MQDVFDVDQDNDVFLNILFHGRLLKQYVFLDQVVATSSGAADCSLFNKALQLMPIEPACLVKVLFVIIVFGQYRPHHHSYYVFQFYSFLTACFDWCNLDNVEPIKTSRRSLARGSEWWPRGNCIQVLFLNQMIVNLDRKLLHR